MTSRRGTASSRGLGPLWVPDFCACRGLNDRSRLKHREEPHAETLLARALECREVFGFADVFSSPAEGCRASANDGHAFNCWPVGS